MADNEEKVLQFIATTNADPETAAFYLDSCQGDVHQAVDRYFANAETPPPPPSSNDAPIPRPNIPRPNVPDQPDDQGGSGGRKAAPPRPNPRPSNIRGFGDLGKGQEADDSDDNEDNEYYAGGEKSGVAVKGGGKKERVDGLFNSAREHGAVDGTERDLKPDQGGVRAFTGAARTLAGEHSHAEAEADVSSEPVTHTITFYADGVFTVNDGEPRQLTDPANASFLQSIERGECPRELETVPGRPVNVNLVRKESEYKPPEKPKYVAFSGQALSLGGSGSGGSQSQSTIVPGGEWPGPDESKPTTSIQIRLHDGSRMVARFNHSHTVMDIRRFIAASRPDLPLACSLVTAFPSKSLTDDSETIEQAGLLNAVVIQKL